MILKKKTFWLMLFILAFGTILRLLYINKPDGLWNDEYVSWFIASIPFGKGFVEEVFAQCHMPFYYLYLKFFIHFFGNSDLILRLTSVPPGVLSILVMYFAGKEFKDEQLGFLTASITALSSFLIYFSQEVRFYGLLFLFASLSLLSTLRLCRKQNLSNLIFYVISSFFIIFTHTIGFVFVFFNLIFISVCLINQKKYIKRVIALWCSIFLLSSAFIPLIFKILTAHTQSQWWGRFTISKIGFLFTDYFSPFLTNIVSAPDNFFYNFTWGFLIFGIIPAIIAIIGIIKALKAKNYIASGLFYVCSAFISVLILSAVFSKLVFVTKYSMEIYPVLILLMSFGLLEFKKNQRNFLIFLFCFLNLFYMFTSPVGAPKIRRSEGHKIVADLLKNADLKNEDFILLNYYPKERFEKYFDFSKYNVISINKGNFPAYLGVSSKEEFKKADDNYFEKKFKQEILNKIKQNQKLTIVILNDVAMYSPMQMQVLNTDNKSYNKIPFFFLIFSYVKNETLNNCLKNLQLERIEQKGSWTAITFLFL